MAHTQEFETFFDENYSENDVFGRMRIPPVGKGAPKRRVWSRCGSGRKLKADNLEKADCYMTYNTLKYLPEDGKNRVNRDKEHVRRLMFCFADLDTYRMAPEGCDMKRFNEGIVQELEETAFGRTIPCPSHIIFSGRGMYFLWKVDEHVNAYPRWAGVQKYLHGQLKKYGSDGAVTTDSARVFRVIGSTNSHSGEKVGLLRDYKKSYTLYEIMTEYMRQDGWAAGLPARKHYYVFHWGNRLYADRMGDLRRLLLTYRDREDACRENILFLYRYYHLCMHGDKEKALKAVKRLNASLRHPLPENEVTNATKSAEKYFDDGCSFGISNKKLLRFLNIRENEMDALHSIKSGAALKEEKRKKNQQAYAKRLKKEGKKPKKWDVQKRRMEIRKLLLKGKKEQEICSILGISRATFYKDKKAAGMVAAAMGSTHHGTAFHAGECHAGKSAVLAGDAALPGKKCKNNAVCMEAGLPRNKGSGGLSRTAMKGGECMEMAEMDEGQLHEFKKKLGLPVKSGRQGEREQKKGVGKAV